MPRKAILATAMKAIENKNERIEQARREGYEAGVRAAVAVATRYVHPVQKPWMRRKIMEEALP
jgi:flagellar biosynthesis/type III secretory pathway protein FliH